MVANGVFLESPDEVLESDELGVRAVARRYETWQIRPIYSLRSVTHCLVTCVTPGCDGGLLTNYTLYVC